MAGTYSSGDKTKAEILKGSRKLFYKNGYTQTTYNDISEYLNINRALIPYHFKSKQTLAFSIYSEIIESALSRADELLDAASLSRDLAAAFNTIIFFRLFSSRHFTSFTCELMAENASLFDDEDREQQLLYMFADSNSDIFLNNSYGKLICGSMCAIRNKLISFMRDGSYNSDELAKIYIQFAINSINVSDNNDNTAVELYDSAKQLADLISLEIGKGFQLSVSYK